MSVSHILVVDDEGVIREGLRRILERAGHLVTLALNGRQALDHMQKEMFDLVISDLKMPGMGGLEVLRLIGRLQPEIPVLIITGYSTAEMAADAVACGAFDFLSKPFTPDQILTLVNRAINWRENKIVPVSDKKTPHQGDALPLP